MVFTRRLSATKFVVILPVVLALVFGTTKGRRLADNSSTTKINNGEIVSLNSVYEGCDNGIGSRKLCFGIHGGNCSAIRPCSHGITIGENTTHIGIVRFQALTHGDKLGHHNYSYAFRLSVDPFENNGMGTLEPKCKKQLQPTDFILRIFRFKNETLGGNRQNGKDVKESVWLRKSDWRKLCKGDVMKEYNSRINTFDTRYIVFQNKFYYDIDTESLGSYVVPERNLEDFKDPDLYSTTDGRLYLNFNSQDFKHQPTFQSGRSGAPQLLMRIPSIVLVFILNFVLLR